MTGLSAGLLSREYAPIFVREELNYVWSIMMTERESITKEGQDVDMAICGCGSIMGTAGGGVDLPPSFKARNIDYRATRLVMEKLLLSFY